MRNAVLTELREVAWIASMVGGLSALGVGLAVILVRGPGLISLDARLRRWLRPGQEPAAPALWQA